MASVLTNIKNLFFGGRHDCQEEEPITHAFSAIPKLRISLATLQEKLRKKTRALNKAKAQKRKDRIVDLKRQIRVLQTDIQGVQNKLNDKVLNREVDTRPGLKALKAAGRAQKARHGFEGVAARDNSLDRNHSPRSVDGDQDKEGAHESNAGAALEDENNSESQSADEAAQASGGHTSLQQRRERQHRRKRQVDRHRQSRKIHKIRRVRKDAARSRSVMTWLSQTDDRPCRKAPHVCKHTAVECLWRCCKKLKKRYFGHYLKYCLDVMDGRDTCITGIALQHPLMPLSFQVSRAERLWGEKSPKDRNNLSMNVGCSEHSRRLKIIAIMKFQSRRDLRYYLARRHEASHICHWAACINLFHVELESTTMNQGRKGDAKSVREEKAQGETLFLEACDTEDHVPRCRPQMQVDDILTGIVREYAAANALALAWGLPWETPPPGTNFISEDQIGKWFPRETYQEILKVPERLDHDRILRLTRWIDDIAQEESTGLYVEGEYSEDEAEQLMGVHRSQKSMVSPKVFLRSLEWYGRDRGPLNADESTDLNSVVHVNIHAGFEGDEADTMYQCPFCRGVRARLCPKPTPMVAGGFSSLRSALIHMLGGHPEYTIKAKMLFLGKEVDACEHVRAAYEETMGRHFEHTKALLDRGVPSALLKTFWKTGIAVHSFSSDEGDSLDE
ncbi:hypothetical protein AB5N19_06794 [Seiridium cardinale]